MRRVLILIVSVALSPRASLAQPEWARQADRSDPTGHTFICTGTGTSDVAALSAAFGLCSEKLCRVCGVDVQRTGGTLIERCARFRKTEPPVQFKHVDCGPHGCRAWLQVFYSQSAAALGCGTAADGFADPHRCEADVDAFSTVTGRSAESFEVRRDALDRALVDCQGIDVRPTPALTALEAKLYAGLDRFESPGPPNDRGDVFAHPAKGWREELRTTGTLAGRLQKIRDVVQDRFLVFTVFAAGQANDLDSPAGVKRLLEAMQACPPGARFGALDDVNLAVLRNLSKAKTDTSSIRDHLLRVYLPEDLPRPGNTMDGAERITSFFASDGNVSPREWDFAMKAHAKVPCRVCLRALIAARDHGADKRRLEHILAAQASLPPVKPLGSDGPPSQDEYLLPYGDPEFLLRIEAAAPAGMRRVLDAKSWDTMLSEAQAHAAPKVRALVARRLAKALTQEPATENGKVFCDRLQERIKRAAQEGAAVDRAKARMCWCLQGEYARLSDGYLYKRQMLEQTTAGKPRCR